MKKVLFLLFIFGCLYLFIPKAQASVIAEYENMRFAETTTWTTPDPNSPEYIVYSYDNGFAWVDVYSNDTSEQSMLTQMNAIYKIKIVDNIYSADYSGYKAFFPEYRSSYEQYIVIDYYDAVVRDFQRRYDLGYNTGYSIGYDEALASSIVDFFADYGYTVSLWQNPDTQEYYIETLDFSSVQDLQDFENILEDFIYRAKDVGYIQATYEHNLESNIAYNGFLTKLFLGVGGILAVELIPNITIGMFIFVPLSFGLLFFFLKMLKGGSD